VSGRRPKDWIAAREKAAARALLRKQGHDAFARRAFRRSSWLHYFWPRWEAATHAERVAIAAKHEPAALRDLHKCGDIECLCMSEPEP
jgi:hypothetical protein